MLKNLFFLFLCVAISSCSFRRDLINSSPLRENNLHQLNGVYDVRDEDADSVSKRYWMRNNFLTEIDRKILADTLKIDSLKSYAFKLSILSKKKMQISYIENNRVIRERYIKTKLKKDGYLYLKNKNLAFIFIPYLAGAIDIKKTRLSKSTTGELVFDIVSHRSGAFMLIIFLDGRTWHYRHSYKLKNQIFGMKRN